MSFPEIIEIQGGTPTGIVEITVPPPAIIEVTEKVGPPGPQGIQGEIGPQGPPGGAIITGWWQYNVSSSPPPSSGQVRTSPDPPTVGSPYTVYLSASDDDGLVWSATTVTTGDTLRLRDTAGNTQVCEITDFTRTVPGANGYATVQTILKSATGTIQKNARVEVALVYEPPPGPQGPQGIQGPPGVWTQMTQAAYDALPVKDPNTLYVIIG